MAIFFMKVRSVSRGAGSHGSHAPSAAAYRAGERIRDERTGRIHDHSRRADVLHKEILLPPAVAGIGAELDWARGRETLWNAAERAERQRNARVAREYILGLPHELAPAARLDLARGFARELAERFGAAVDLVVHAPRTDARNFHAHLLTTTRVVTPAGLGAKTSFEWNGTRRYQQGLVRWREELDGLRERWAVLSNDALRQAGLEVRVSHRGGPDASLRTGQVWLPRIAYEIEKRGGHSVLGDIVRQRHAASVQARGLEPAGSGQDRLPRGDALRDAVVGPPPPPPTRRTLEQIRAQALEEWQALRRRAREAARTAGSPEREIQKPRGQEISGPRGQEPSRQDGRAATDDRAPERARDAGYGYEW